MYMNNCNHDILRTCLMDYNQIEFLKLLMFWFVKLLRGGGIAVEYPSSLCLISSLIILIKNPKYSRPNC